MAKHVCENRFHGEGARGGSYVVIHPQFDDPERAHLKVGHSCVVIFDKPIPITWLAELIAIATEHKSGIAGFLAEHQWSGLSYALMCDPAEKGAS